MRPAALVLLVVLAACKREHRPLHVDPPDAQRRLDARASSLQPGPAVSADSARPDTVLPRLVHNDAEAIAYAMSQGKQLFAAMNCVGCHAHGGGGMGPALMDSAWIYGSEPAQIYRTIVQGRPNGMPSFGRRIPDYQVRYLVAYVRSLSGLVPFTAAPGRADQMFASPPENSQDTKRPVPARVTTP